VCWISQAPIKIKIKDDKKMKNKKILFGTIVILFAISGICSIPNVSSAETIEMIQSFQRRCKSI